MKYTVGKGDSVAFTTNVQGEEYKFIITVDDLNKWNVTLSAEVVKTVQTAHEVRLVPAHDS